MPGWGKDFLQILKNCLPVYYFPALSTSLQQSAAQAFNSSRSSCIVDSQAAHPVHAPVILDTSDNLCARFSAMRVLIFPAVVPLQEQMIPSALSRSIVMQYHTSAPRPPSCFSA